MTELDVLRSTMDATWLSAFGAVVTAAFAVVAGWTAISTLRQLKRDSASQSRPYVYAILEPSLTGAASWDVVISNSGQSAARNLLIEIDPWPEREDYITETLRAIYSRPQVLPPGVRTRTFWSLGTPPGMKVMVKGRPTAAKTDGFLASARMTVQYKGDEPKSPTYRESFVLDFAELQKIAPMPESGHGVPDGLKPAEEDQHRMLGHIVRAIREQGR